MTVTTGTKHTYTIDTAHSGARFAIRHLMIAHVRGEFSQVSGTVVYDPGDLTQLSVDATVDTNSFHSGHPQRDEHVKGEHFLDVAKYPTITFVSKHTVSNPTTAAPTGETAVVGDLTLHGVTQEVTLTVHEVSAEIKDPWGNLRIGVTAVTQIKRSDFGISFNAPMESGGVMLSDEVDITLDLQLTRSAE